MPKLYRSVDDEVEEALRVEQAEAAARRAEARAVYADLTRAGGQLHRAVKPSRSRGSPRSASGADRDARKSRAFVSGTASRGLLSPAALARRDREACPAAAAGGGKTHAVKTSDGRTKRSARTKSPRHVRAGPRARGASVGRGRRALDADRPRADRAPGRARPAWDASGDDSYAEDTDDDGDDDDDAESNEAAQKFSALVGMPARAFVSQMARDPERFNRWVMQRAAHTHAAAASAASRSRTVAEGSEPPPPGGPDAWAAYRFAIPPGPSNRANPPGAEWERAENRSASAENRSADPSFGSRARTVRTAPGVLTATGVYGGGVRVTHGDENELSPQRATAGWPRSGAPPEKEETKARGMIETETRAMGAEATAAPEVDPARESAPGTPGGGGRERLLTWRSIYSEDWRQRRSHVSGGSDAASAMAAAREALAEAAAADAALAAAVRATWSDAAGGGNRTGDATNAKREISPRRRPSRVSRSSTTSSTEAFVRAEAAAAEAPSGTLWSPRDGQRTELTDPPSPAGSSPPPADREADDDFSRGTREVLARRRSRRAALLERQRALAERLGRRNGNASEGDGAGREGTAPPDMQTASSFQPTSNEDPEAADAEAWRHPPGERGESSGGRPRRNEGSEDRPPSGTDPGVDGPGGVSGIGYFGGPPCEPESPGSIARLEAALHVLRSEVRSPLVPNAGPAPGEILDESKGDAIRRGGASVYPPGFDLDAVALSSSEEEEEEEEALWAAAAVVAGSAAPSTPPDRPPGVSVGDDTRVSSATPEAPPRTDARLSATPEAPPQHSPRAGKGGPRVPSKQETLDLIASMEERARNKHAESIGVAPASMATWTMARAAQHEGGELNNTAAAIAVRGLQRLNRARAEAEAKARVRIPVEAPPRPSRATVETGCLDGVPSAHPRDDASDSSSDDSAGLSPRWSGAGTGPTRPHGQTVTGGVGTGEERRHRESCDETGDGGLDDLHAACVGDETGKLRDIKDFDSLMAYCFD